MKGADPVPGGYGIYRWTETSWEQAPGGAVAIDVARCHANSTAEGLVVGHHRITRIVATVQV